MAAICGSVKADVCVCIGALHGSHSPPLPRHSDGGCISARGMVRNAAAAAVLSVGAGC